jgi:hypothetical protein
MVDYTSKTQNLLNAMNGRWFTYKELFSLFYEHDATFRFTSVEYWGSGACEVFAYTAVDDLYQIRIMCNHEVIQLYGWFKPDKPIEEEDNASRTKRRKMRKALQKRVNLELLLEHNRRTWFDGWKFS